MKVAGIVAEYNPFHIGHAGQIAQIRQRGFDAVVAVMSGNFVQRAEPALTDKYRRAEAAVAGGADLIVELPLPYTVASAEDFARGGIGCLSATGVVNEIFCGCESGGALAEEQFRHLREAEARGAVAEKMKQGLPYPAACRQAVTEAGHRWSEGANDLLYLAYRKALSRSGDPIGLTGLKRDADHRGSAGGKAIRDGIKAGEDMSSLLPAPTREMLKTAPLSDLSRIERGILGAIRTASKGDFSNRYGIREGIEHRIVKYSDSPSLSALYDAVKTKRFPHSAVRRAVLCFYLGIPAVLPQITYLRILAFNDTGRALLKEMKEKASLPLLDRFPVSPDPMRDLQLRGDEIFALTLPEPGERYRDRTENARYLPGNHGEL